MMTVTTHTTTTARHGSTRTRGTAADDPLRGDAATATALRTNVELQQCVRARLRRVDAQLRYIDSLRCALERGAAAVHACGDTARLARRARTPRHAVVHDDPLHALRMLSFLRQAHQSSQQQQKQLQLQQQSAAVSAALSAATACWGYASTAALLVELKRRTLTQRDAWPQPFDAAAEAACQRAAAAGDDAEAGDGEANALRDVPAARVWQDVAQALRAQGLVWCSALACYRRAQELLADRCAYTRDEDALLCELVSTHGRCWWYVATRLRVVLRVRRTPFQLALRYRDCTRVALFDTHRPIEQTWQRVQRALAKRDVPLLQQHQQRPSPHHRRLYETHRQGTRQQQQAQRQRSHSRSSSSGGGHNNNNNKVAVGDVVCVVCRAHCDIGGSSSSSSSRYCSSCCIGDSATMRLLDDAVTDDEVAYVTVLTSALRAPGELSLLPKTVKAALEYGRTRHCFASARALLYWKMFALLCNVPYAYPQRLDAFAARAALCYAQLTLHDAAALVRVDADVLHERVRARLRRARRDVLALDYEKLSTELFGHTRCARLIFAEARILASMPRRLSTMLADADATGALARAPLLPSQPIQATTATTSHAVRLGDTPVSSTGVRATVAVRQQQPPQLPPQ